MLHPVAGSRLFIADAPVDRGGALPAGGWVEIGEVEAIGSLGAEWSTAETEYLESCDAQSAIIISAKQSRRETPMQIVLGNDPTDPGQVILWRAVKLTDHYPFRLEFSDGVHSREWLALVISLTEVFDGANSVMKLQATIIPTQNIQRSEAT